LARLVAAGAFLLGIATFVAGLVVEVAASWRVGTLLIFFGASLMTGWRYVARRFRLPAP
jgi:hypothetical protein